MIKGEHPASDPRAHTSSENETSPQHLISLKKENKPPSNSIQSNKTNSRNGSVIAQLSYYVASTHLETLNDTRIDFDNLWLWWEMEHKRIPIRYNSRIPRKQLRVSGLIISGHKVVLFPKTAPLSSPFLLDGRVSIPLQTTNEPLNDNVRRFYDLTWMSFGEIRYRPVLREGSPMKCQWLEELSNLWGRQWAGNYCIKKQ